MFTRVIDDDRLMGGGNGNDPTNLGQHQLRLDQQRIGTIGSSASRPADRDRMRSCADGLGLLVFSESPG